MCLFDLVCARNYKALTFSDFTYGIVTFSLFGTEELLRFAFNWSVAFHPQWSVDPTRSGAARCQRETWWSG